jgi:small subunit ribosomal protein S36
MTNPDDVGDGSTASASADTDTDTDPVDSASSVRTEARRSARRPLPRRLWLVVVLQAALMLGTMILYPDFQQPDEAAHIDYVLAHRHGVWLAGPGDRPYQSGVLEAQAKVANTQARVHVGGSAVLPRSQRPSFDALGTAPATSALTPLTNQMVQHPPLYYGLAAGFSYLLPGFAHHRFDIQILWLRLLSLLLLLPVPILIFLAVRHIADDDNLALVAALIPLSIPSYLRTGASVNNDALLVVLTTALLLVLVRVTWGDLTRRTALLAGGLWGLDLLTKGFALDLPPVIVACYLVGASGRFTARVRQAFLPALICGVGGSVIGAWWWIRNVIDYSVVQPNGFGPLPPALKLRLFPTTPTGTESGFVYHFFRILVPRFWGSLGLIDRPGLSTLLLWIISLLAAVLIVVSIVRSYRPAGWRPGRAAVLCLPVLVTIGLMGFGSRSAYLHGRQLPGLQARYLEPDLLGIAVCIAMALWVCTGRLRRFLAPVVLTVTLVFLALSAYKVLTVEMSRPVLGRVAQLRSGVHYVVAWAPWPAAVSAGFAAAGGLLALVTLVTFWRSAAIAGPSGPPIRVT